MSSNTSADKSTAKPSRAAATREKKTVDPKNDRLLLANAISSINARGDAFIKAIDDFKTLKEDLNQTLENEFQVKKRQREELDGEYEQVKRSKKIELDQDLREHGYQAALKLLADKKQVPIDDSELTALRARIKELEAKNASELKDAITDERTKAAKHLEYEKKTMSLQHEKEVATITSNLESLKQQLLAAREENKEGQRRLERQIVLTEKVADSASKAQIVQNLGGK